MARYVKNEEGVALMLVLVMSAVILAVMTAMIYMISGAAKTSGSGKRYASCMEASLGSEVIIKEYIGARGIIDNIHDSDLVSKVSLANSPGVTEECLNSKIWNTSSDWPASCDNGLDIDIHNSSTYDFTFSLGDYDLYAKIDSSLQGNSRPGTSGYKLRGVAYQRGVGEISSPPRPYSYRLDMETVNRNNPEEKCAVEMLYHY